MTFIGFKSFILEVIIRINKYVVIFAKANLLNLYRSIVT